MRVRFTLGVLVLAVSAFFSTAAVKADDDTEATGKAEKWLLMKRTWNFKEIASTFDVVSGRYDPATNQSIWVIRLNRDLKFGTVGTWKDLPGTPFKIVFLDEDGVGIKGPDKVTLTSELKGMKGDLLKIAVEMPDKEASKAVKSIRVDRRTAIGF